MDIVINTFMAGLEVVIILFCFNSILHKRTIGKKIKAGIIGLVFIFNVIRSLMNINPLYNLLVSILFAASVSAILYKDGWYKKAFAVVLYILIFMVSEVISQYIVSIFTGIPYAAVIEEDKFMVLTITDFIAFMICLYFINIPAKKIMNVPIKYWIAVFLMPLFSLAVLLLLDTIISENMKFYMIWSIVIIAGLMYCNIMFFNFFENYSNRIRLNVAEQIIDNNQKNYEILEANEKELRILSHDILKHMAAIKEIVKYSSDEKVIEYAKQLEKTADKVTSVIYTGNAAMDSTLNIAGRIANVYDIKFFVKTNIVADINISDIDITALLKNALDNAIEAQEGLEKRCIVTNIVVDKEKIKIDIDNFSNEVTIKEGFTTKNDKQRHGFGLQSIRSVVEKYNGEIKTKYDNGIFTLSLLLDNIAM